MTIRFCALLKALTVILVFAVPAVSPTASAADGPKLAMQGYDTVAYFTDARPTKGKPEFSHVWDGERYEFASASNRDRFAQNPERYAPQFPGYCAAALTRGEHVVPDPQNWVIIDGKLYLFGKAIGPALFRENPTLAKQADGNWARMRKSAK